MCKPDQFETHTHTTYNGTYTTDTPVQILQIIHQYRYYKYYTYTGTHTTKNTPVHQ